MDLYSHVWSLGTTRRRGRGVGAWGGGGDTTRPRQRLGPPTPPRNPRTLKSPGSAHSGPACPCPPTQALGSLRSGHNLPVAPSRVLGRGELPPTLLTAGWEDPELPRGPQTHDLPRPDSLICPKAPDAAGRGLLLRRFSPWVPASPPPKAAVPRSRLRAYRANSPRRTFLPGRGRGITVPCASATPPRCRRAGTGASRPLAARRRSAPRAWPASSGVALGGPRSSLRPPERTLPAQPRACWVPAWPDSAGPADPGILARRRPKPGNRDQR